MAPKHPLFRRYVALPSDHGSWALLLSPLLIGLAAGLQAEGGALRTTTAYLVVACLAAFLLRQPLTLLVKMLAGRRSREDLPAVLFWCGLYGGIALLHVAGLVLRGFGFLLYLALPGGAVFAWYLHLVSRRRERRQLGLELLAAGALALAAPAGLWIGVDRPEPVGWLLWLMVWAQSAASLVHVYLRLEVRRGQHTKRELSVLSRGGVLLPAANLGAVAALGLARITSLWLVIPYALQLAEALWGYRGRPPAPRPKAVGMRQLAVSSLFTLLFILLWSR